MGKKSAKVLTQSEIFLLEHKEVAAEALYEANVQERAQTFRKKSFLKGITGSRTRLAFICSIAFYNREGPDEYERHCEVKSGAGTRRIFLRKLD